MKALRDWHRFVAFGGICLAVGVAARPTRRRESLAGTTADKPWPRIDQTQYVGSAKCAECHASHYESWKVSAHNKMIRPPIASGPNQTVFADFSKPDANRPFDLKDVKWVIGHRWKQ